ncbi:hypothetical protein VaNZ11_000659, partial [Volvox africanus]
FVRNSRVTFKYSHSGNGEASQPQAPADAASHPLPPQLPQPQPSPGPSLGGPVRVISPFLLASAPGNVASLPLSETRFMGPFYVKVISTAQVMEWIWLDSLREIETPW